MILYTRFKKSLGITLFLLAVISFRLYAQPACVPTNCCCGGVQEIDVPNGDFEGPPFAPPTTYTTYFAGETFMTWTVQTGSVDLIGYDTPNFAYGNPNGASQHVDMNGFANGVMTNTLSGMTAGYTYTIVLWYAKNPGTPLANCNIRVAGGAWLNASWSATNNGGDVWLQRCFTFVAQAATAELRFSGTSNVPVAGMLIDDITMWECPNDALPPVVSNPPAPFLSYACPDDVPPVADLIVSDNCTDNPAVTFTESTTPKDCYFSLVRVWEVVDECNNTVTFTQNIDVQDNEAPVFDPPPTNMTVNCGSYSSTAYDTWLENLAGAVASDNCDQDIEWVVTPLIPFNQSCGVYPVLFRLTDDCMNTVVRTAQFLVLDNQPPILLQPALNDTIVCPVSPADSLSQWLASHGGAMALDSCGAVTWTNNFTGSPSDSVIVVTFTATDPCGNDISTTASFVQYTANDTIMVNNTTCDPQMAGQSVTTITQGSCTNVLITNTSLVFSDSVNFTSVTCVPAEAGVFTQNLTNQFGCDSIVVTTVTLAPTDTLQINAVSCNPNDAGTFVQNLTNQYGCDSTVVTTIAYDPSAIDTTILNLTTCDPLQAGIFETLFTGADGCDSLVITFVTSAPNDQVAISATTCDPAQTGTFTQNLTNQFGCDSTVVTTVTLLPSDMVAINTTTCDPAQTGTFTQNLTNQFGCDSTVVTTVTLLPSDMVALSATTCDPAQAGTFTQNLTNQFGCDSTVVTTVTLLSSDMVALSATTCDPAQAGTFTQNLTNQSGCDSTVVTTVTLLPSDMITLSATTCDPAQAGTFTQNLTNQFGCDSTVVTAVTLLPSDQLNIDVVTCDQAQAGTFTQNLTNQYGCDSTVVTTVTFDAIGCAPVGQVTGVPPSCGGASDGSFTITATNGQVPLQYTWPGGSGTLNALNAPATETGLTAGVYNITLTDANGLSSTLSTTLTALPGLNVTAGAVNSHNGFTLACAGDTDGAMTSTVNGGTAPFTYLWNNGAVSAGLTGIGAGIYGLTVTDSNGCTGIGSAEATAPPALSLDVITNLPECGDATLGGQAIYDGGVPPLKVFVNSQQQSGSNLVLSDGSNTVSVQDANGCAYDTTFAVNLPPVPQVGLPADVTVALGESLVVEAIVNVAVWDTIVWTPLPDPACAGCPVQEFNPLESMTLTVTLMDTTGCSDDDIMHIRVEKRSDIYVPNVFSPNDDGREDFFQVNAGPSVTELLEVAIFDRWGDKLYAWNNPIPPNAWPGWDGKVGNEDMNPGVFAYYLIVKLADGSTMVVEGDVTLVR